MRANRPGAAATLRVENSPDRREKPSRDGLATKNCLDPNWFGPIPLAWSGSAQSQKPEKEWRLVEAQDFLALAVVAFFAVEVRVVVFLGVALVAFVP